jgi:EAL domain-containing protein (putative c-di-GMP-specific phosphodiesterase class I)
VASVLDLARSLGVVAVAEGIERAEQHVQLLALGCGLGQGYLWSPPMTAPEAALWAERADIG